MSRKPNLSSSSLDQRQHRHDGFADLARMMIPSDANIAGNVHGGTIMKLMEEAAGVAANRYFASSTTVSRVVALLSRVERLTFQHPIHVGDVAQAHAKVVFASQSSVAVCVQVRAERMAWSTGRTMTNGDDDHTTISNRALLWLVGAVLPSQRSSVHQINPKNYVRAVAPPFPVPDQTDDEEAWMMYQQAAELYEQSKKKCDNIIEENGQDNASSSNDNDNNDGDNVHAPAHYASHEIIQPQSSFSSSLLPPLTPAQSAVELVQVMQPADCVSSTGLVSGGVVMKLMDNACGVVAVRHCGTNTVTVSVNCVNLIAPVLLGDVLKIQARPVFTSSKSIEIMVSVMAERFSVDASSGTLMRQEVVTTEQAYFTFVALPLETETRNQKGTPLASLPMRPLLLETERDRDAFEKRKIRYQQRKASSRQRVMSKL